MFGEGWGGGKRGGTGGGGGGGALEFTLSLKFEFLSKYIQCNYSIHCWNL